MLKFCFKCNKSRKAEEMVPRYNRQGRKTGVECKWCAKRQSVSFISAGEPPKPERKPIPIG